MKYYNPTCIFDGAGCVKREGAVLAGLGSHALIVTGKRSARACGALADVTELLDEKHVGYTLFEEVEENPSVETCEKGAKAGLSAGADFVIGIGGGSPIDAAKAIAVLIRHPELDGSCMLKSVGDLDSLPLAAIATTCGTGAEVTPNAVLTYHQKRTKGSMPYSVFPKYAFLDGTYLMKAPRSLLVNTAVDALCHLCESYLSAKAGVLNRMCSSYGLQLFKKEKDFLSGNQSLTQEMAALLLETSTVAGLSISQTQTSLPHALSYFLTYEKGVPHGRACGTFLIPYVVLCGIKGSPVEELLELLDFESLRDFADWLYPLLGKTEVSREEILDWTGRLYANPAKMKTIPYELTREEVEGLGLSSGALVIR